MKSFWHQTTLKKWLILVAISVVLEIFLFNIRHFELLTCKSEPQIFSFNAETVQIIDGPDQKSGIRMVIDSKDCIPEDLRNVKVEFSEPVQSIVSGSVYTQETDFLSGHVREFKIIPGVPHSQSIYLYPSNRVEKITLDIYDVIPQTINLQSIKVCPLK
jgi:hypothetical protein